MSIPGIRFITSNTPGSGNGVGIGLSAVRGPTGPAGAFGGPQGNVGIQGTTGTQGVQGLVGLQGLIGFTGAPGINGVQGLQGLIGPTGSKGNDGPQGLVGHTGSIGPQGGAGMGFVVFANTTSYTGLNTVIATGGNIGQFVLVLGGDLFVYAGTGSGYTGPGNSYGYAGDITDESKLVGLQGYQGPTGSKGNDGLTGLQGATGSQGYQGLQGSTGAPGTIGINGLQGPTGTPGTIGINGLQGPTGAPGTIGINGLQGPTGTIGINGVQGLIGATGPQGLIGATGPSNPGVQGLAGPTGALGLQGLQGLPGVSIGSLANVKLSYTRTTDSPSISLAGNRLFAFSGATGGVHNTIASNITFTPSNGRFTVSEQGDYYIDARLIIKGQNNPDFITTDVYVNTGTVYNYTHVAYGIVSPVAFPIGLYLPLNIGDYVNIACYSTGTGGPIFFKAGTTMNMFRITNGPTGSIGVQGLVGATGAGVQGPTGSIGLTGLQGATGSVGLQGLQGSTGSIGYQGLQGPTGSKGNDGLTGLQGATGSIGPQGGAGMGFVVFANTTSYTGLSDLSPTGGNIGQFVLVLGGDLFVYAGTGSGYTGPDNSYGYAGDVTDESKLVGLQGNIGLQGPTGSKGNDGLTGLQGSTGSTGAVGPQGLRGPTGPPTGLQGPAGQDSSAVFQYIYNTSTTNSDPGPAYFKLNNSTMGSATALYIDVIDYDPPAYPLGNDLTDFLSSLTQYGSPLIRGVIKIQKAADSTWYQSYNFSTVTNNSGWFTITLNNIIDDANFTNNDICYISFILAGPRGATGSIGYQGLQGYQGYQGHTGLQGYQGETGMQGYQGYQGHTGLQGYQGYQGHTGLQGYQGYQGHTGLQGYQGYQGHTGLQGYQGHTGMQGPGFSTITNYGNNKLLISTGTSSNSAIAYDNLNYDGTTLSAPGIAVSTLAVTGTFQFGTPPQIFYPHGANGFSVNENFDASNSATQTAYHYTSGDQTRSIVFDIAVTNQYTTMFGTHGNNTSNEFIIGSETANTDFIFKQGLGIQPINLAGGTELFKISSAGSVTIPNKNAPENLTDFGEVGQLAWDNSNFYIHTDTIWQQIPYGGVTGPQGLVGHTGMQGYQGHTGLQGYQGPQGIAGPTGVGGALGYYGSFYDTTIQSITIANTGYVMTYNTTLEANGIFISNGSRINFQHGGVYNLQFSAQFDKTDSGTDTIDVWLRQNGVNVPWSNTKITSVGNNDKKVAAWNFMQTVSANDYLEIAWSSNDISFRIYAETGTIVHPEIPSVILTVQQVMNTQIGPQGLLGPQGGGIGGASSQFMFNQSGAATGSNQGLTYLESPTGGLIYAGTSIIPSQDSVFNLGSPDKLWKSIYISTGTVFIGPTGTLGLDNNGVISSAAGFATPFVNVGSITPGNGITLYNQGDKLWFQNQYGASGPISIFNVAQNSVNNTFFTGGNIGIGTTTPVYPLDVKGTIYCEGLTGTNFPVQPIGGLDTQIIFNKSGNGTGSSNLSYNYTNNVVTLPNVIASSGSFTNLLLSSSSIHLGGSAGSVNQKANSVAIGNSAGQTNQGTGVSSQGYSVAVGHLSGNNNQGYGSVSIGYSSGQTSQGELSVAIGTSSGNISQGTRSVGIGQGAGYQHQGNYSISMGDSAGQDYQGTESVAIGRSAGLTYQNPYSVAIGSYAGSAYQSTGNVNAGSVAVGTHAGQTLQQYQAVAIGSYAGNINQGANSIAIGANAGQTNQANNSIIINASGNQINPTGTGLFINPLRTYTQEGIMTYNTSTSEIAYSTTTASIPNLTVTTMTGGTINVNQINIGQGGIYFSSGGATGCFISGLNYNTTGADHYVYYNSRTHELTQSSPVYFFSYSTGVQLFTGTNNFQAVRFDTNNILYHTFQHVGKSSVFTGTFMSQVVLNFEYSLQMHTTAPGVYTTAAALYLDDVPIPGSYRSLSVKDKDTEYILSNDIIVTIPSGSHTIVLKAATTNTSTQIGGAPNIAAPDQSYTSANLRCTRVI
jgi:hypothetical protein